MVRYHRMKGRPTLWIPGTDHAGIATQVCSSPKCYISYHCCSILGCNTQELSIFLNPPSTILVGQFFLWGDVWNARIKNDNGKSCPFPIYHCIGIVIRNENKNQRKAKSPLIMILIPLFSMVVWFTSIPNSFLFFILFFYRQKLVLRSTKKEKKEKRGRGLHSTYIGSIH